MLQSESASSHPKSPQQHYDAGKALCQSGKYEDALSEFQQAVDHMPASAAVQFWVGMAQAGLQRADEAIASFQQSAHLDPTNAKPHLEVGNIYVANDQFGAALASFRQALRLSPSNTDARRRIASVLIQQSQYDSALEELQQALQLNPDEGLTYILLGRVYDLMGLRQQSEAAYRQSNHLDPHLYAQAQLANGMRLEDAGHLGDAIKQYRQATLTDPTFLDAFLRLGLACLACHYTSDAADAFRAAVHLDPDNYVAHYTLGYVLLENSQVNIRTKILHIKVAPPDEAIRALIRAVDLLPGEAAAHYTLGKAYEAAGAHHLAKEQMENVLAIDPDGENAASAREFLQRLS